MGEVWEADHTRLPKQFAIKFMHALSKPEPEQLMRFRREAEIASRLAHPSIVQVTDFNTLPDGTAYIAMERLSGEDLRARLGRGALPLAEAREITRQVASALWTAHQQGIVHRDLKPENIFLCREPDGALRAKVLDFGISKLRGTANGTRDDRVLGTPGYMAPEQALGKNSEIDGRTDVFALATIVSEMLTGEGVFVGDTLAELCTKVLYHTPPPLDALLPSVPRPVAAAVSTALAKDPAARQSDIRAFSDAILGVPPRATSGLSATVAADVGPPPIDAVDVLTRSERPQPASPSQPVRRRLRYALSGAALVALAFAGSAWWQMRPPPAVTSAPLASAAPPVPAPALPEAPPARAEPEREVPVAPEPPALEVKPRQRGIDPGALTKSKPVLSGASLAALVAGERALVEGRPAEALRLARGTLQDGASEPAFALMARAYCAQRDVGMVQAMLRNLSSAQRRQVRAQCAQAGLSLP